jgi:DNA-binding response OmpR family regulator
MRPLDREILQSRALVIDGNPTSRSLVVAQLRDLGVNEVTQASRPQDARRHLESRTYDLVICEYHFDHNSYSGRDLLDDLRRAQLLPYSTVFVMVTSEASYAMVAEAAEAALDSYLLKPYAASALEERLAQARRRKKSLAVIFEAIEAGDFEAAAAHCLARFAARQEFWLYAARIGAELLLRLGRPAQAQELFTAVIDAKAAPWAKLGVARAQVDKAELLPAKRTLESLLADQPTYADAWDVMGRVHLEQGHFAEALDTYRRASAITPGSIGRLQKQGLLAFYLGETQEAAKSLERAVALGRQSKLFDFQTLVMLGVVRFDERDAKGLQRCLDDVQRAHYRVGCSPRLMRFTSVLEALRLALDRQPTAAAQAASRLVRDTLAEDADLEAACNALVLLSRLAEHGVTVEQAQDCVRGLALRFCVSKASTDMLARSAERWPDHQALVHDTHHAINRLAEQSMSLALAGRHAEAVRAFLHHGEQHRNSRLIDMGALALQRYRAQVAEAEALDERVQALRRRFDARLGRLPVEAGGTRPAGGLALRVQQANAEAEARAAAA